MRMLLFLGLCLIPVWGCNSASDVSCVAEGEVPREGCGDFCAAGIRCDVVSQTQASCEEVCECQLRNAEDISEACGDAWQAEYDCFSQLDCQGIADFFPPAEPGDPCEDEVAVTDAECFEDGILRN